jgi:hypothetical protein
MSISIQGQQPAPTGQWDYNQPQQQHHHMQPMYHHQPPQAQPTEWYYPNHHQPHGYNAYNNYKTDYNCLNQPPAPIPSSDPSMYNGVNNYYYPQNPPTNDPYANAAQATAHPQPQMAHPQIDYQHSNYHQNYSSM